MSIKRLHTNARMSQSVIANGFVFLAGQVATDTTKDVSGQTAEILAKIDTGASVRAAEKIAAKEPFEVLIVGGGLVGRARVRRDQDLHAAVLGAARDRVIAGDRLAGRGPDGFRL